jgi:hypothetical protein
VNYLYQLKFSNGKRYVGVSNDANARYRGHLRAAEKGARLLLSRAIRKHGAPKLKILVAGSRAYVLSLEVRAIAAWKLQDSRYGYNATPGGDGITVYSAALKRKLSRSKKKFYSEGPGYTPEWRAKISAAGKGRTASPETRVCRSKAATRRWKKAEFRKKACRSLRRTMRRADVRAATSTRVKNWWAAMPIKQSKAIRAKISATKRGQKRTPYAKRKTGFSVRWAWAQKKAAKELKTLAAA